MIKTVLTAYIVGVGLAFVPSTLFFAFQIFRPGGDIWRGALEGTPRSKGEAWAIKTFFFLIIAFLMFLAVVIWPIALLFLAGLFLCDRFTQEPQEGENDDCRR